MPSGVTIRIDRMEAVRLIGAEMLQMDKRKVIPLNSNSSMWAAIQPVCEVLRG